MFFVLEAFSAVEPEPLEVRVDFAHTNGVIKPLHGVNLGPLCYRGTVDLSEYYRELGIPWVRLHDVVWVNAEAVDIHTIFPDLRADPEQAENYFFAPTDDYLQSIVNVGAGMIFRLGESIEHTPRKYRVHPPADPERWAAVCVGIVRHYNDGWAEGFHHNIRYWEIWNEPDVRPAMWTGNDAQYFQLYAAAARAIKARFPAVKVGGPALGHSGDFVDGKFQPSAFFTNFLAFCREQQLPLDFYSWHRYTPDAGDIPRRARAIRQVLDAFGFNATESHLNEWNYLPRNDWTPMLRAGQGAPRERWYAEIGGPAGAAFVASVLCGLHDAPLDLSTYYTGDVQGFGLFNIHGVPKKTFYVFKAFRELLNTPCRATVSIQTESKLSALAGVNEEGTQGAVLFSNFGESAQRLKFAAILPPSISGADSEVLLIDASHDLAIVRRERLGSGQSSMTLDLPPASVMLVKWRGRLL